MLTDIFAIRYEGIQVFKTYSVNEKRLLHQAFTILEDAYPYFGKVKAQQAASEDFWDKVHKRVANELGVRHLSRPRSADNRFRLPMIEITRNFVKLPYQIEKAADSFIKERISIFEVGMRMLLEADVLAQNQLANLGLEYTMASEKHGKAVSRHKVAEEELNLRFEQAKFPVHYHNGFVQLKKDELISAEIEQPFWSLVSDPIWKNVDLDMKEALDQLDTGAKDPSFHAGKAFESVLKIISKGLGVTHGGEKGAHSFIDNLGKKGLGFVSQWEATQIKHYFTEVRNPLGHGPGEKPMPSLDGPQSSWAIEVAMSWIKLLVERYDRWDETIQ